MSMTVPAAFRSTTARFVILIFIAQFTAMFSAAYFVRAASERTLIEGQQALVSELRDELVSEYASGGRSGLVGAIEGRLAISQGGIAVLLYLDASGHEIAGNLDGWPPTILPDSDWQVLNLYRPHSKNPEDIGFIPTTLSDGSHLLAGHVIDSGSQLHRANEEAMAAALLFALPLSLIIALLLVKVMNLRISAIAQTADAVTFGDFAQRVEIDGTDDAFDRLGHSINVMLERIQSLVSELRVVTDGLAHDLRSPITRLKSVIERAMLDTNDSACLAVLEKVSVEAETLLAMLTTALQISRAEAGIGRDRFVSTDLSTLFGDLVEIYGPLAEDRGFVLSADDQSTSLVPLHREMFSQALGNLIENALKYADGGSWIALTARQESDRIVIGVADNGTGIALAGRELALKRFGRLDPARHIAGSGLGLSLVEAIARLHGGDIELADNDPGLSVRISLNGPFDPLPIG